MGMRNDKIVPTELADRIAGFDSTIENLRQSSKPDDPRSPSELSIPEFSDFSYSILGPLPEFDCIEDWIMETDSVKPCPDHSNSINVGFGCSENDILDASFVNGSDSNVVEAEDVKIMVEIEDPFVVVDGSNGKLEEGVVCKGLVLGLGSSIIEEEMGKVSLVADSESSDQVHSDQIVVSSEGSECLPKLETVANGNDRVNEDHHLVVDVAKEARIGNESVETVKVKDEEESDSSDSDMESDSYSATSSSSLYSSSDEEEEEEDEEKSDEEREIGEVEEGEIKDLGVEEIIGDSDEDEEGGPKGPIRSKNEVEVLPHVPQVDVTLKPHHQTLPVGVILTILGAKVIVEGSEKHNPLNEGSILWITETRLPLGIVDEIFGPVKNPYYVVRYNSDQEVPAGINEGTLVSFVAEFVDHVLNDKNIYKKGYDASGDNDEEVSNEVEFSDDEKEAEYRRAQKMTKKKAANDRKRGNQEFVDGKKAQNKGGSQRNARPWAPPLMGATGQPPNVPKVHTQPASNQHPGVHAQPAGNQHPGPSFMGSMGPLPNAPNLLHTQPAAASYGCGSCSCSVGMGTPCMGGPQHVLPFNGMWTDGTTFEPQPQMPFPTGLPMNWVSYQQQNHHQHAQRIHAGFNNDMPIQPQFQLGQRNLPNVCMPPCVQPNFSQGPPMSWPVFVGQAGFNQAPHETFVQGCHSHTPVEQQGVLPSGPLNKQSNKMQPSSQFNPGSSSGRGSGRRSNHRGGFVSRGRGRR